MDVRSLLTPKHILAQEEFDEPYIILPKDFERFEQILKYRDYVRDLKLCPLKDFDSHAFYNSLGKEDLFLEVQAYLKHDDIVIRPNKYPYLLPANCEQMLIWIKKNVSDGDVIQFIENYISENNYDISDIILFERPFHTTSKYVKGTFPHVRHIHLWRKTYAVSP